MKSLNKVGTLGAMAAMGVLMFAAAAWACVAGPTLVAEPQSVAAGQQVKLSGITWNPDFPVVVRFNALDGPVLGEFLPDPDSDRLDGVVTIPQGTAPGNYVLVGTQQAGDGNFTTIPVRALVSVQGDGGAPVLGAPLVQSGSADRPTGLVESDPVGTGSLVLAGVGVAGVALFIAGAGVFLSTRRRTSPERATVGM